MYVFSLDKAIIIIIYLYYLLSIKHGRGRELDIRRLHVRVFALLRRLSRMQFRIQS